MKIKKRAGQVSTFNKTAMDVIRLISTGSQPPDEKLEESPRSGRRTRGVR